MMKPDLIYENGDTVTREHFKVVRKLEFKDHIDEKHKHPGKDILLTLLTGHAIVSVENDQDYDLKADQAILLDGDQAVQVTYKEDSEVIFTVIDKK